MEFLHREAERCLRDEVRSSATGEEPAQDGCWMPPGLVQARPTLLKELEDIPGSRATVRMQTSSERS